MSKYLFAVLLSITTCGYSQENRFSYKPFSIYSQPGGAVIAGSVNTYIYTNYFGRDVKNENYTDVHAKPESVVYELFRDMKSKNISAMAKLYDTSFHKKYFDENKMAAMLAPYDDIKFQSKFRSGDLTIVRYDFISSTASYPYFAVLHSISNKYYLTREINVSDPFNLVGSYSPANLFERPDESLRVDQMTPFYFIRKENKIFFTNELPAEDHTALYLAFNYLDKNGTSPEVDFIKQLQKAVQSVDPAKMRDMVVKEQLALLSETYYSDYYFNEIKKVFKNFPLITPLATLKTNDGEVLFFKYADVGQSANIASIILKGSPGQYSLSLKVSNDDISNVLQNTYIREAILDYFKRRD